MKDYRFLRFLDKFKGAYTKFGVDYDKMRLILAVKLTLDSRRTSTIMKNNNKGEEGKTKDKNTFLSALIMYAIMGIFIGIMVLIPFNKMYAFTISFGIFMFLTLTVFISDFSNVLLDVRDKNIIGTKGVDDKTINAAKITHICYYIFLTSLALAWLAIIGMFRLGIITGLLFILELIITDILMVVITALLYLLILRFFDGEKVKDIINFVQIALTIIMVVGYQVMGQMFNIVDLEVVYETSIWNILVPPMWFAAPLYALNGGEVNGIIITLIILAIAVPVIAITLYIRNNDKFEASLYKLNLSKNNEKVKKRGLLNKLGRAICRSNEEKASYDLALSIMKREREFKLMTYPNLAFMVVFPLLFVFIFAVKTSEGIVSLPLYLSLNIYWFIFMFPNILMCLQYSNNYKAAWIYQSAFISDRSNLYKGTYKALLINMLLPLYLLVSIIFVIIFGIKAVPILLTAFIFMLSFIVIGHKIARVALPFSVKAGVIDKGRNLVTVFAGMALIGVAAAINFAVTLNIFAMIIYGIVLAIIAWVLWKWGINVPAGMYDEK